MIATIKSRKVEHATAGERNIFLKRLSGNEGTVIS
jgi:hypothetical protein